MSESGEQTPASRRNSMRRRWREYADVIGAPQLPAESSSKPVSLQEQFRRLVAEATEAFFGGKRPLEVVVQLSILDELVDALGAVARSVGKGTAFRRTGREFAEVLSLALDVFIQEVSPGLWSPDEISNATFTAAKLAHGARSYAARVSTLEARLSANIARRSAVTATTAEADATTAAADAKEAAGTAGTESLANHFDDYAKSQKRAMWLLRGIGAALFGAAFWVAREVVFASATPLKWDAELARLALTVPILVLAYYALHEASHHRNASQSAMENAVRLQTVRAFTGELPTMEQMKLRYELGMRVFLDAPNTTPAKEAFDSQDASSLLGALTAFVSMAKK